MREHSRLKAQLTRAINSGKYDRVERACRNALAVWESDHPDYNYGWPDDWNRWERALNDLRPWHDQITLDDLRS